jgi:serpin B
MVNALWGQRGYHFLPGFLDTLAQYYGAGLRALDFGANPDGSRITINNWVADQTAQKIKDLLPPRSITPETRLVLTNAVYFKAGWKTSFTAENTREGPFTLPGGSQIRVPMMTKSDSLGYLAGDAYVAVELPYKGDQLSMILLVPPAGGVDALERGLNASQVSALFANLERRQVALTLPKFRFEFGLSLAQKLRTLGMEVPFTDAADFSAMTAEEPVKIGDVIHKAFIGVDEKGTEAAAATAVIIVPTSVGPGNEVQVTVDRPFLFLIRDIPTSSVLFLGRVGNPAN